MKFTLLDTLLHACMQLHLPENTFLTFSGIQELTGLASDTLVDLLRSDYFDEVWDPERRQVCYIPSAQAFDHVVQLFYAESASPFTLDREALRHTTRPERRLQLEGFTRAVSPLRLVGNRLLPGSTSA